jgi:glycosyltransferase involved in cell wall biosynthesis
MKIVFVSNWYSENMGYIENCLPKALADLGHEVHLITSTGQVYFNQSYYETSFKKFLGDAIQPEGTKIIDGVKVHRLPYFGVKKRIILKGLTAKIKEIKPDVVHAFEHADINTLRLVFCKLFQSFKLFTANHTSSLALAASREEQNISNFKYHTIQFFVFKLPGRFISPFIKKCFCVTIDAAEVAQTMYGVSKSKAKVTTLGVNTDIFHPDEAVKAKMRKQFGFQTDDIVCIYTGKFSNLKKPVLLAQAIETLNARGLKIKGLFVGDGEQLAEITKSKNCKIVALQQHKDLPPYYQLADIAVWPYGESSSQLDATSTGLCLILSDVVQAYDTVHSDTPFIENQAYRPKIVSQFYKTFELEDLIEKINFLATPSVLAEYSALGMKEINEKCSWHTIALNRIEDYKN